jgi:metallophosphoesterase
MKKKIICKIAASALAMITSAICCGGCSGRNADKMIAGTPITTEENIMTLAIFSDVHIGKKNTRPEEKFTHALETLPVLAPSLDAIAFAGDLTDRGTDAEYQEFMKILNQNTDQKLKKIYCMGNHEYFRDGIVRYGGESKAFLEECQKAYQKIVCKDLDTDTVINGVHVISISARSSAADYSASEEFLISHVEAAAAENPNLPIIILSHEGAGSFFEGGCGGYTAKTLKCLQQYPQIIFFSGHTHFALQDVRMIQQQLLYYDADIDFRC